MNKKNSSLLLVMVLISSLFTSKGVAMGDMSDYKAQIKEKYKKIDLPDGVSKEEAIIIAQNYIIDKNMIKVCNIKTAEIFGENDPYWDKNSWHISFKTTVKERLTTGTKWITISIDKKTGRITGTGGGPDL